jgi:23S rRNA (adenine2503-C2)-methyltransferase
MEINLAISLHAPNDELRSHLMRVNTEYSIGSVLKSIDNYIAKTRRKVMFEYLMLKGINDHEDQAYELAGLLSHKLCMVNLIQFNPTNYSSNCHAEFISASHGILKQVQNDKNTATSVYESSNQLRIEKFLKILEKEGIEVTRRYSFGQDIQAACGQLIALQSPDKPLQV